MQYVLRAIRRPDFHWSPPNASGAGLRLIARYIPPRHGGHYTTHFGWHFVFNSFFDPSKSSILVIHSPRQRGRVANWNNMNFPSEFGYFNSLYATDVRFDYSHFWLLYTSTYRTVALPNNFLMRITADHSRHPVVSVLQYVEMLQSRE
jgi:hypothetical protein